MGAIMLFWADEATGFVRGMELTVMSDVSETSSYELPQLPVEKSAPVNDHHFQQPYEVEIEAVTSNTAENPNLAAEVFEHLEALAQHGATFVLADDLTMTPYLSLTRINRKISKKTGLSAVHLNLSFKEVRFVKSATRRFTETEVIETENLNVISQSEDFTEAMKVDESYPIGDQGVQYGSGMKANNVSRVSVSSVSVAPVEAAPNSLGANPSDFKLGNFGTQAFPENKQWAILNF